MPASTETLPQQPRSGKAKMAVSCPQLVFAARFRHQHICASRIRLEFDQCPHRSCTKHRQSKKSAPSVAQVIDFSPYPQGGGLKKKENDTFGRALCNTQALPCTCRIPHPSPSVNTAKSIASFHFSVSFTLPLLVCSQLPLVRSHLPRCDSLPIPRPHRQKASPSSQNLPSI